MSKSITIAMPGSIGESRSETMRIGGTFVLCRRAILRKQGSSHRSVSQCTKASAADCTVDFLSSHIDIPGYLVLVVDWMAS